MMYAFGCYDTERVLGLAVFDNTKELFSKETICKSALPKALPQRMPLPAETISVLCNNRLMYFEPKEWDAPKVTVDSTNVHDGFAYDDSLISPKIKKYLSNLGYNLEQINLAYQMKVTVPFPNMGLFIIVVVIM